MPRFDVTIAGELNLDLILYGLPDELPRERELLANRMVLTLGSSSAIVAHNLAALGARVGFISCIGDDPLGQIRPVVNIHRDVHLFVAPKYPRRLSEMNSRAPQLRSFVESV